MREHEVHGLPHGLDARRLLVGHLARRRCPRAPARACRGRASPHRGPRLKCVASCDAGRIDLQLVGQVRADQLEDLVSGHGIGQGSGGLGRPARCAAPRRRPAARACVERRRRARRARRPRSRARSRARRRSRAARRRGGAGRAARRRRAPRGRSGRAARAARPQQQAAELRAREDIAGVADRPAARRRSPPSPSARRCRRSRRRRARRTRPCRSRSPRRCRRSRSRRGAVSAACAATTSSGPFAAPRRWRAAPRAGARRPSRPP